MPPSNASPFYEGAVSYVELRRWVEQRPTCLHSWFPWPFLQDELVQVDSFDCFAPTAPPMAAGFVRRLGCRSRSNEID